jgi:type VI secretion system secreted protein Hcp
LATPAYLRLEIAGSVVEGSSPVTTMDREGTIECHSFTHSVNFLHAERGFAAKRHHEVVAIKKQIDRSSPLLIKALCEGSVVSRADFRFYHPEPVDGHGEEASDPRREQHCYTVSLRGGSIVSVAQLSEDALGGGDNGALPAMEEVHFTFKHISWKWEDGGVEYEDEVP